MTTANKPEALPAEKMASLLRFAIFNKKYFVEHDPDGIKTAWIKQASDILNEYILKNYVCSICLTEACTVDIAGVVQCKHCHNPR